MQINIDKKTGSFLLVITILLLIIGGLLLSNDRGGSWMHRGHMSNDDGYEKNRGSSHKILMGAEVMFLQMMIPHHQQAVDISNLALDKSKDTELRALAESIRDTQVLEIDQMKLWLNEAGAGLEMGHSMPGMGGMLSEGDLAALDATDGNEFDALWLKAMIDHHDGAIDMVLMIESTKNKELRNFGEKIVKTQGAEIKKMRQIIKRIL